MDSQKDDIDHLLSDEDSSDLSSDPESPEIPDQTTPATNPTTASSVSRRLFNHHHSSSSLKDVSNISNLSPDFSSSSDAASTQLLILEEVKKTNNRFDSLSQRLECMESRIIAVGSLVSQSPSSSADSSFGKTKNKIPPKIRLSFLIIPY